MKEKHKQVYEFILKKHREGVDPSLREICSDLGISSTSTAARYVNSLVEMGLLERNGSGSRNIRPAGTAVGEAVPIIKRAEKGRPVTDPEDVAGYVCFRPESSASGELFAYRVTGDDLSGAGILSGDIAVLEDMSGRQDSVKNGDIVLAAYDNSLSLRKYYYENGHCRLEAENDGLQPVFLERCTVLGRLAGIVRYVNREN